MSSPTSGPGTSGPGRSGTGSSGPSASGKAGPSGKGRPTPKRSQAQVRRGGPVPPPPRTRKEAAQRARQEARESRARVREGRDLLPRDAGPVRALVRDVVDSRRSIGVLMLPLALVLVTVQILFPPTSPVASLAFGLFVAGMAALAADMVVTSRVLRRRLAEEHPELDKRRSHISYGLMRSTVFRRWRLPAPRVSPGSLRQG